MTMTRIEADYLIETSCDPREAAEIMAGEQSSGTFVAIPGETPELKARAAARVERLQVIAESGQPSLPGARTVNGARIVRIAVTLSWPFANIGPSLPNLITTVAGNLFELKALSGIKILDLRMPAQMAIRYPGPKFSVAGTRRLTGVEGRRPLIGTIIKPSVGLTAEDTAVLVDELCTAGIDFIKDDELQADGPACPFEQRARAVMVVINRHADRVGRKTMYAFNLTGDLDQMRRRHDLVVELGGTCVMASLNSVGLVGMIELGRHTQLPIHAHRNGWGYLSRHPLLGWSYVAWQKIWRLAGADHMHVNGLANKFCEPDECVIASARTCLASLFPEKPCLAMPVFSSGQSARQAAGTFAALQSTDLIYAAGGGVLAHPNGVTAGVLSLRQAWEAAVAGIPVEHYARECPELARALDAYAA
jgi:3-oxoisoapionate-4-phosphate transcarboxylase/hydrolase